MPQTRDIALEQLTAAGNALTITGTRVDAAHSLGDALASDRPLAEMPVAEAIAELLQVEGAAQLQSQADQLAAHLRLRQQEIDRREAQLNARLADFEKEVRDARLWLAERNEALNEREARLAVEVASVGNALSGVPRVDGVGSALGCVPQANGSGAGGLLPRTKEDFDRRQIELEKFREKVSQMHREALQLRLSAEEAQAELRASLGEERAEEAIALGRRRLNRYFQEETAELTRLRNELEWLRSEQQPEHVT